MKKCDCGGRMEVGTHWTVKGKGYRKLPGYVRVYRCTKCTNVRRTIEIDYDLAVLLGSLKTLAFPIRIDKDK